MPLEDAIRKNDLLLRELSRYQRENTALREQATRLQAQLDATAQTCAAPGTQDFSAPVALLQGAVEAAQLSVWEYDVPSRQIYLDKQWGIITGTKSPAHWQSADTLLAQLHPEDAEKVLAHLANFLAGNSPRYSVEHRVRSSQGWSWIESMGIVSARNADGQVTRMVGANINITARKAIQNELVIAQAHAEMANQAKSEFLANMSHEVRTPLNAIMGLARLLVKTPLDTQQSNYLTLMQSAATGLLAIVNDVLDLSKIEAGKLVLEQIQFDLQDWVESSVSPLAIQAQEKGILVNLDIARGLPPSLVGDPGRLRQVLYNLIANAVKFTERGEISIRVWPDPHQESVAPGQLRVLFQVKDSGIGMTPAQLAIIFESFTQADASTTRRFGGTGLGLTICERLVHLMGGKIRVSSQPGQGSAFRFSAVLTQAPPPHSELTMPAALEAQSLRNLRVLLAEDQPINRLLMSKLLEELECIVEIAENGQEALEKWAQSQFDLVLMDIQMPVMGGEEATAKIRASEKLRGSHTPIVALTAHALVGDREKYLAAGMDAYVSKPVSPDTLTRAMHLALQTGRTESSRSACIPMPTKSRFAPETPDSPSSAESTLLMPTELSASPVNVERLLLSCGGSRTAMLEMVPALRNYLSKSLEILQTAGDKQDAALACQQASALHNTLGSAAIDRGAWFAKSLELAAYKTNWPSYRLTLIQFRQQAALIDETLRNLR